jgi:hypothetical protein
VRRIVDRKSQYTNLGQFKFKVKIRQAILKTENMDCPTDDRTDNRTVDWASDWTDDGTGDRRYYRTNTTTHARVFLLHFVHRIHKLILKQQDIYHVTGSYTVYETDREHG